VSAPKSVAVADVAAGDVQDTYSLEPTAARATPEAPGERGPWSTLALDDDEYEDDQSAAPTLIPSPPPLPASAITRLAGQGSSREPWYYVFLDRYAVVVGKVVLGLSAGLLVISFLGYLYGFYSVLWTSYRFDPIDKKWSFDMGAAAWSGAGLTLAFLAVIGAYLLVVLVPVLFALSLIHVVVDAGRNLRAIRASLSKQE
jgi:hypothetical protein